MHNITFIPLPRKKLFEIFKFIRVTRYCIQQNPKCDFHLNYPKLAKNRNELNPNFIKFLMLLSEPNQKPK